MANAPRDQNDIPAILGTNAGAAIPVAVDSSGNIIVSANLTATAVKIEDTGGVNLLGVDSSGRITTISAARGTPETASATGSAAASTTATLATAVGKTTYITGFAVTTGAATAAVVGLVTVAGLITGTISYQYQQETTAGNGLIVTFPEPVPASTTNTTIVVNIAAATGGGVTAVNATGFQL